MFFVSWREGGKAIMGLESGCQEFCGSCIKIEKFTGTKGKEKK